MKRVIASSLLVFTGCLTVWACGGDTHASRDAGMPPSRRDAGAHPPSADAGRDAGKKPGQRADAAADAGSDASTIPDAGPGGTISAGCGKPALHAAGGVQITIDAGPDGDGQRGFWLSRPAQYDASIPHKLIVGYPGTDWVGQQIQPYLGLEADAKDDEIFVYLDPLRRDFAGWGNLGGWLLGPNAAPANGNQDLVFTAAVLDYMNSNYCIDSTRVFVTGHSWGGDMANVAACWLGDRIRASVPIAANRPYWFESPSSGGVSCKGNVAVWLFFGSGDDYFTAQTRPGDFGDQGRDFWIAARGCTGVDKFTDLGIGAAGECLAYDGCSSPVRYCLYGASAGHQRPDYYPAAAMAYFRSF